MAVPRFTQIGPYQITGLLGEGGMGTVYRAKDTKLNREVAIKVLPHDVANDPQRLARFRREAQVLASLNHPNVGGIYGFEDADRVSALVLELVEGPTLADRLQASSAGMPLDEALPVGRRIAEALEAAHAQGIIHRDLKPANIKVSDDGRVKVLDFGLAKLVDSVDDTLQAVPSVTQSPTITSPAQMTAIGMILGTAAYMSPEQARGRPADRRADIWAFGCVLFEMLTGRRAFPGDNVTDTLAAIVRGEPDWTALPPKTPAPIRTLLKGCLEKDRVRRIADASTIRFVIDESPALTGPTGATVSSPLPVTRSARFLRLAPTAIAFAVALGLAWPAAQYWRGSSPAAPAEMRFDIVTPPTSDPAAFALAPDGRSIVFAASDAGRSKLWIRSFDQTSAKVIPNTEDASFPFWSPDGRSIGFFAGANLLILDLAGGSPRTIADAPAPSGAAWAKDGSILFTPGVASPLFRVSAAGGTPPEPLTQLSAGVTTHAYPIVLPDGRHYLYSVVGTPETAGVYYGSLDQRSAKKLTGVGIGAAAFAPPDRMLFFQPDRLMAQRFDFERETLIGESVSVTAINALGTAITGGLAVSTSRTGLVAYRAQSARHRSLVWRDRAGTAIGRVGEASVKTLEYPTLSPDGQVVAGSSGDQNVDIWLVDLTRKSETRFTFDAGLDSINVWSPDGRRLAFDSSRSGRFGVYAGSVDRPGTDERLFDDEYSTVVQDWSRDGRFVLFYENNPTSRRDVWALDLASPDHKRLPVAVTPAEESIAKFSPDGRWIAYQTNASGRLEIVVQGFGGDRQGGRWQISKDGGVQPHWSHDGKELYFIAPDGALMATTITAAADTLSIGAPVRLFSTRINSGGLGANALEYDVSRDGKFLINEVVDADVGPITIVVNPKF